MSHYKTDNNYPTISAALARAAQQKQSYENNLVGKQFLYVYINDRSKIDSKTVVFDKHHYLHLTGLDYKGIQTKKRTNAISSSAPTDADEFYKRLGTDTTLSADVSFIKGNTERETKDYYKYTQRKLDNLSQLTRIACKASYIGKYKGKLPFDVIINRNFSSIAFIDYKNVLIPVSSLYGTPDKLAENIKDVLAIFSKKQDSIFMLEYLNAAINIGSKLFEEKTLSQLQHDSFFNDKVKFNQDKLSAIIHSYEVSVKKQITETDT